MTTWLRSVPSNQTTLTHQHNLRVEGSPSDPLEFLEEKTLESQEEYPQEVAEEVEEVAEEEVAEVAEEEAVLLQYPHHKQLPMGGINSLAIPHLYSQEIAPNQKNS